MITLQQTDTVQANNKTKLSTNNISLDSNQSQASLFDNLIEDIKTSIDIDLNTNIDTNNNTLSKESIKDIILSIQNNSNQIIDTPDIKIIKSLLSEQEINLQFDTTPEEITEIATKLKLILDTKQIQQSTIINPSSISTLNKLKFTKHTKDIIINDKSQDSIKLVAQKLELNLSSINYKEPKKVTDINIPIKETINIEQKKITDLNLPIKETINIEQKKITDLNLPIKETINIEQKKITDLNLPIKETITPKATIDNISQEPLVQELKDKIFDSKVKIKSFMSDISRKMVENYKPPLTALKISLNPKELGPIEVVIRGSKNNLNISFQANPITMDILTQNQSDLRASLTRQFTQEQAFTFNFSDQSQNQSNKNTFTNTILEDEDDDINEETIINLEIDTHNYL